LDLKTLIKDEPKRSLGRSYYNRSNPKRIPHYTLRKQEGNTLYYTIKSVSRRKINHNIVLKGTKNNIKIYCSCESFLLQGFAYRNTANGSGAIFITMPDHKWSRIHGGALLCTHLLYLLKNDLKEINKRLK
jgi:hypothetical protein